MSRRARDAPRGAVGVMGEAVGLHLLEAVAAGLARRPAAQALELLVEAQPPLEKALRADHLRGGADRRQLADEDLRAGRGRRAQRGQAALHQAPVHARRLRARLQEEDVVGLVPDREVLDGREAVERARVAAPDGAREAGEVVRVHLVVAAATAGRRPVRGIGSEREHHAEALRERPGDEVVVGLEARIRGRVGGVEGGLGLGARAGRHLAPLHLDTQRVGAERHESRRASARAPPARTGPGTRGPRTSTTASCWRLPERRMPARPRGTWRCTRPPRTGVMNCCDWRT